MIDPHPVEVVDTTGAGDLYAAGFLFGLTHGRSLAECGQLGSVAASAVLGHTGRPPRPVPRASSSRRSGSERRRSPAPWSARCRRRPRSSHDRTPPTPGARGRGRRGHRCAHGGGAPRRAGGARIRLDAGGRSLRQDRRRARHRGAAGVPARRRGGPRRHPALGRTEGGQARPGPPRPGPRLRGPRPVHRRPRGAQRPCGPGAARSCSRTRPAGSARACASASRCSSPTTSTSPAARRSPVRPRPRRPRPAALRRHDRGLLAPPARPGPRGRPDARGGRLRRAARARSTRRRPRSGCCRRWAPTSSACPRCTR